MCGLLWDVLKNLMSSPGLREFNRRQHTFCPETFSQDPDFAPSPLTAFLCLVPAQRVGPRTFPAEMDALAFTLEHLRHSFERLALTIEAAPLAMIRSTKWPRVPSLHLQGIIRPTFARIPGSLSCGTCPNCAYYLSGSLSPRIVTIA